MHAIRPLSFKSGWVFQDQGEELTAFEQHFGVAIPSSLIKRVWPYAEGLLSTTRRVGTADGRSVWWMKLLKLRLPKACDWDAYHTAVQHQQMSPIPSEVFHDLISVHLEERRNRFYDAEGTLRFLPFGGAYRFLPKPETFEEGFLCFEVSGSYSVWYLPAKKKEECRVASSFEEMMAFPQRKKK